MLARFTGLARCVAPDGREMVGAYRTLNYDFVMTCSGR
jgi:hypothetical protein